MDIFTLLKADIRSKKGSFIGIILLMMIITLSFSVTVSNNDNVNRGIDRSLTDADTGDFAVFISDEALDGSMLDLIASNENIERFRTEDALIIFSYNLEGNEGSAPYFLMKWENNLPVYDDRLINFADSPAALDSGEIYLPAALKTVYGCEKGSKISVSTLKGEETFIVKGFIEDAFTGSMSIGIKQLYISEEDFSRMREDCGSGEVSAFQTVIPSRVVHIFKSEESPLSTIQLKKELNRLCLLTDKAFFTMSRDDSVSMTTIFTDTGTKILAVYVVLLVIIVMLVINHSIETTIETEYVSLGILKSQGFTKKRICLIYSLRYIIALVIGAAAGIIFSIPLTAALGKVFQLITGIMAQTNISIVKCLAVSLAIIAVCTVCVFAAASKIGRVSPVRAIAGGAEDIYFDSPLSVKIRSKPLYFFIALRQITSHPAAYCGTALTGALLVFFMITISLLAKGMSANSMIEAFGAIDGDVTAKIGNNFTLSDIDALDKAVKETDEGASVIFSQTLYVNADDNEFCCLVYSSHEFMKKTVLKGRTPDYRNEIMITEIMAEELGKSIGDTVTVSSGGISAEYLITGLYQTVQDLGRCFTMTFEAAAELGDIIPSAMYVSLSDDSMAQSAADMLNSSFADIITAEIPEKSRYAESMTNMIDTLMNVITASIYSVSAFFAAAAVGMVCSKAFLREKTDLGIYKAFGFTSGRLRKMFAVRFLIVAAVGSVLGAAASAMFSGDILSAMLKGVGISSFEVNFTAAAFLVPVGIVCVCFFGFSYFISKKIKSVDVRELISE